MAFSAFRAAFSDIRFAVCVLFDVLISKNFFFVESYRFDFHIEKLMLPGVETSIELDILALSSNSCMRRDDRN